MEQTIFALSTGQVKAAVAIIRVSGPLAWAVSRMFCKKNLSPRRAELVDFFDPKTSEYLDVGLIIWFPGPHSYTGEDVVEFQLHGSSAVTSALLSALSGISGLRLAEVGEFTRRAFQNDKMSLDTVEGLADLLEADTQYERRQALHRMQGNFGNVPDIWRLNLVEVRALIEASLDFTEEADIPQDVIAEVIDRLRSMTANVSAAIKNARRQEILRGGFLVLIAGPPNVGKSTLLNCLVQREVAITSQFAGTTRDLIEVPLNLGGMRVVLVDSAGLRDTDDPIEKIGLSTASAIYRILGRVIS
jgi:tRNA modification GTPase